MRVTLAFAACAVAFRAPTPPLRQRVTLRAADLDEIRKMRASAIQQELRAAGRRSGGVGARNATAHAANASVKRIVLHCSDCQL